jgi:hypothetical protein
MKIRGEFSVRSCLEKVTILLSDVAEACAITKLRKRHSVDRWVNGHGWLAGDKRVFAPVVVDEVSANTEDGVGAHGYLGVSNAASKRQRCMSNP